MNANSPFDTLFDALADLWQFHGPGRPYQLLRGLVSREIAEHFGEGTPQPVPFGPFGDLAFPFHSMGAVTSLDLFGLDELILFAFYRHQQARYRRVADIGANVGLHSIILRRCGYEVRAFEPDPKHLEILRVNLRLNNCEDVSVSEAAVSSNVGSAEFVRVLGNTTGSHLAGSKANPYGPLVRFPVVLEPAAPIFSWADLVKVDAEGHEREIVLSTTRVDWAGTDAVMEVGTSENAAAIFDHLQRLDLPSYAQKLGWARVGSVRDMPANYREGSLFVSGTGSPPWATSESNVRR